MPNSTVLGLVFEVIMSQRHWVMAPLHTQHIYISNCVCVLFHMYVYSYIMHVCVCHLSLIVPIFNYVCEYLSLGLAVAVVYLEGFE